MPQTAERTTTSEIEAPPSAAATDPEELSDADLLARFVEQGDQRAFTALHDRYETRIKNFVGSRYGLDDTRQEDLWQETMLRVYRHAHRYDPEVSAFRNWVYMIASNLGKNVLRNGSRDPQVDFSTLSKNMEPEDRGLQWPDSTYTPDRAWDKARAKELVEKALLELKPHHRATLVLLELRGYRYQDTSAVLGIALGTVKSRKNRALEFFRQAVNRLSGRPVTDKEARVHITEDGDLAWTTPEQENGASPWSLMWNGESEGMKEKAVPETPDEIRAALRAQGWTRDEETGHWLQPSKRSARVFLDDFVEQEPELAARWFVHANGNGA